MYTVLKKTIQGSRDGFGMWVKTKFKMKDLKEKASKKLSDGEGFHLVGPKISLDRTEVTSNKHRAKLLAVGRVDHSRHEEVIIYENPMHIQEKKPEHHKFDPNKGTNQEFDERNRKSMLDESELNNVAALLNSGGSKPAEDTDYKLGAISEKEVDVDV